MSSPWVVLLLSGILESAWALGLKASDGFSRLGPSLLTVGALIASMGLLALATRDLPIGTAYAVWVGIGAVGTALGGILLFDEPYGLGRLVALSTLIASLVGLKLTS